MFRFSSLQRHHIFEGHVDVDLGDEVSVRGSLRRAENIYKVKQERGSGTTARYTANEHDRRDELWQDYGFRTKSIM